MKIEELEKKSITELKAIVYDLFVSQQAIARDLQIVNKMIADKEKEGVTIVEPIEVND